MLHTNSIFEWALSFVVHAAKFRLSIDVRAAAATRPERSLSSEPQFQRQLCLPRIVCGRDRAKAGIAQSRSGIHKVRMIEDVEEFTAELKSQTLDKIKVSEEREVHVPEIRSAQAIASSVPV